jgi:hypothetical protein
MNMTGTRKADFTFGYLAARAVLTSETFGFGPATSKVTGKPRAIGIALEAEEIVTDTI